MCPVLLCLLASDPVMSEAPETIRFHSPVLLNFYRVHKFHANQKEPVGQR